MCSRCQFMSRGENLQPRRASGLGILLLKVPVNSKYVDGFAIESSGREVVVIFHRLRSGDSSRNDCNVVLSKA